MKNTFTKEDLRTGDVVLHRDGRTSIVIREFETLIAPYGYHGFEDYREDLMDTDDVRELDIVAVRRPVTTCGCQFDAFKDGFGTLVYERREVEEMTLEQVCKLLGKEIKIIK